MTDREIDQILGSEPEIVPSRTFADSVMRAVRSETATPSPLKFPWLCLVPAGAVFGLVVFVLIAVPLAESGEPVAPGLGLEWFGRGDLGWGQSAFGTSTWAWLRSLLGVVNSNATRWIAAAFLVTAACVVVPLRLVRGRR